MNIQSREAERVLYCIDGQLDYSDFPPPEYKYFLRLSRVGYNNRHKDWDINICLEWQYKLRTAM
ncbi:hypothetical protein [Ruminococcus sp.]|uniref:hypothetical protein n=1 Tax=Ruminococcus sp. TaxID=41978 RepID=UPI0025E52FC9|nr:hypothetical protein [Ruminococcus sp.]